MIVINEGHKYVLTNFDSKTSMDGYLQFVDKKPYSEIIGIVKQINMSEEEKAKYEANPSQLILMEDGTTNEEVLEVLIDRMQYLQGKFPCRENAIVITHLEEALMWLEKRTRDRIKRNVEGKQIA